MYVCLCVDIARGGIRVRCGLGMRSLPADRPRNHRRTRRQRCGAEARAVDQGQAAEWATVAPSTLPSVDRQPSPPALLPPAIDRPLTRLSFSFILAMFIKMVILTKITR